MSQNLTPAARRISWAAQLVVAAILLQTLFFKFTGAPESIYIFQTLGLEPVGRIGSGIVELIASVLLLVPGTAALGALLAAGVIVGALGAHLTKLGIEVQGDGGLLFALALVVFVASLLILWLRRAELPLVGARFARGGPRGPEAHGGREGASGLAQRGVSLRTIRLPTTSKPSRRAPAGARSRTTCCSLTPSLTCQPIRIR